MSKKPSYLIAICGSAGSMDELFTVVNKPLPRGCAYVIVQHLPADFKARLLAIPFMYVLETGHAMYLRKNNIYLLPDNQGVSIRDGRLQLTPMDDRQPGLIDHFLESLATAFGSQAIAVILAGEGTDGSVGVKAVKTGGGTVLVRNPMTTGFSSLPASAIATGAADQVLEPAGIAEALHQLVARVIAV